MNFAQLRAFHAVVENGSFAAASEKLCVTQPAVTLQVKALQQRHGLTLLYRRGRSIHRKATVICITVAYPCFETAPLGQSMLDKDG